MQLFMLSPTASPSPRKHTSILNYHILHAQIIPSLSHPIKLIWKKFVTRGMIYYCCFISSWNWIKLALRCKLIADYIMCLSINGERDFLNPQFLYIMKNNYCFTGVVSVKNYIHLLFFSNHAFKYVYNPTVLIWF